MSILNSRSSTPQMTVIYDAPDRPEDTFLREIGGRFRKEIYNPDKSSLTELWNQCIIMSPTDWVLVCNDDIEFKPGWLEYLEEQIDSGCYDLIHLFHYGAFCIHKYMMLKVGWFDERFRGGGYEDNDYQLRIYEAGLKDRVDRSHDFIRRDGAREVGHFIDHTKYVHNGEGWQGCNNAQWIQAKWANMNWRRPSIRQAPEIDWHPSVTKKYTDKYGINAEYIKIGKDSMSQRREIYH